MSFSTKGEPVTKKEKIKDELYIVGIGASAGGLAALQELFDNIPENSGLAFVIIQHLSPDYKSLMGEILSKHTSMRVVEASEGMELQPNCVYLLPSKKTMTVKNGRLMLEDKPKNNLPNTAIDHFLTSLAEDKGEKSIAIILSGTGTDGTRGIEAVKAKGGTVMVQDPMTAEFDGMPTSVIATGYADFILPPEMMADELVEFLKESPFVKVFNPLDEKEEAIFHDILGLIRRNTDHDFSYYKKPTLTRRLAKRIAEKNIRSIADYYEFLRNNQEEIISLSKDFLINVTKFFRDTEAFEVIRKQVIPSLFSEEHAGYVKIWIAACSTGEEAYSIAMLVHEYLEANKKYSVNVKIFATDIDQEALNIASRGIYSAEAVKHISQERIDKFFLKEGSDYAVAQPLRKMVVFARHNVIKDPPFSKVNFLSCRNMLIYINASLQKTVLKKFHFGLADGGYLMLGPSENLGSVADYFADVDKKWKVYKCVLKAPAYDNDNYLTPLSKDSFSALSGMRAKSAQSEIAELFKDTLIEEYKLAGIYIDRDFVVKQAIGNFKAFLDLPEGKLNFSLLNMVCPDLSIALSMAVRRAIKDNERFSMRNVSVADGRVKKKVNIIVKPYGATREHLQPFVFVILEEVSAQEVKVKPAKATDISTATRIIELERELTDMRENLQAVIEEAESTNEELHASNEEIISANEELQSTNEELQSVNEELHTVNAEYQSKIKELTELNDDQNNYFNNTDIGQIFVDKKLIIRKFTPAATKQINLIPSDVGRSVTDISTNFKRLDFLNHIKDVMRTGRQTESEVTMEDGKTYLMRINQYVRQDRTADGVVINFIDVSETKRLSGIIEAVFNSSPNGIIAVKAIYNRFDRLEDFQFVAANKNVAEMCGVNPEDLIGKSFLRSGLLLTSYFEQIKTAFAEGSPFHGEYLEKHTNAWIEIAISKMTDGVVVTLSDITHKKKAEHMLLQSFEELKKTSDQLSTTNTQLEQSNYDLVQFASVASHDLKEPLRKIQVFGSQLKERIYTDLPPTEKNFLDKIISSSNRMQNLIEDVLTLSKLSNNDKPFENVSLSTTLSQIIEDLDITINEKKAQIRVELLPEVWAVPGQMRQLFQNLISNSLKFCKDGPPEIKITTAPLTSLETMAIAGSGHEYCCIEVKDNGIGFEEKYYEKVFSLFQRLNGNQYPGTGLGLAICKKIMENHNGLISVKSTPGSGTTFRVVLPTVKTIVPA